VFQLPSIQQRSCTLTSRGPRAARRRRSCWRTRNRAGAAPFSGWQVGWVFVASKSSAATGHDQCAPARPQDRVAKHIGTSTRLEYEFAARAAHLASRLGISRHAPPLPERSAETYTAHVTANLAVQSNKVYLTPCTACAFDPLRLGVR
jgi:hypothetical protein